MAKIINLKPSVTEKKINSTKSKAQIKYEKLLHEIEQQHQMQITLKEGLQKASTKIEQELSVLIDQERQLSRAQLIRLDELKEEIGIGKYNREWFDDFMATELEDLLEHFGRQDTVLAALFTKYSTNPIDTMAEDDNYIAMAAEMSDLLGFEVDPKEILEKGAKAFFDEHKDKIFNKIADDTQEESAAGKQTKKAPKQSIEDAVLLKDARNIYLRLIKKFHPDLEPDLELKLQKTEIVKQVTRAYQENDFFNLLKLQITHLDEGEADANAIAADMLKRYNKLLQNQLDNLRHLMQEMYYNSGSMIDDFIDKNGKFSPQKFAAQRRELQKSCEMLEKDLEASRKKPKTWFKDQLKAIKQTMQEDMMENMMANMFIDMRF